MFASVAPDLVETIKRSTGDLFWKLSVSLMVRKRVICWLD